MHDAPSLTNADCATRNAPRVRTKRRPILELWLLRLLVPLNGQRGAIGDSGFRDSSLAERLGMARWCDCYEPHEIRKVRSELRQMHAAAEGAAGSFEVPARLRSNIARLARLVGLDDVDCRILEFTTTLHNERVLDDAADHLGTLNSARVIAALAVILGIAVPDVRRALDARGMLAGSGLISLERRGTGMLRCKLGLLSERFADVVEYCETDPVELLRDAFSPALPGHLTIADFAHLQRPLSVLMPYLRKALSCRRAGVNILLHGLPGTGKTQLVKALAAELRAPLYEVASEDSDGDPVSGNRRLRSLRAAQCTLRHGSAFLLFDETQDVFGVDEAQEAAVDDHKAWLNRTLEHNPVPTFWLTNSIGSIDTAFLRRFDMVIECAVPPRPQRLRIIRDLCEGLLDEASMSRLADCDDLPPAITARAASMVRFVGGELGPISANDAVLSLVEHSLRACGHAVPVVSADAAQVLPHDISLLNADADLAALTRGIQQSGRARLCLYGPPGTGKTAWAQCLAWSIGRRLIVRRASDLLSRYVGDSEKRIAAAFQQAEAEGAVLLIDEVDSFLRDRGTASHGWETTLVNEMLTRMESHEGVFIATTNATERLDPAAMRRFDLKISFGYLREAQVLELTERLLAQAGMNCDHSSIEAQLRTLPDLAVGDFASVARRHRLTPLRCAQDVVDALRNEARLQRRTRACPIGFTAAA